MRTGLGLLGLFILLVGSSCSDDLCPGQTRCGGVCADLATSPSHCGTCGHACGQGQVCVAGECVELGCQDECPAAGELGCASPPDNGIVVCADFVDDDPCLEWGGYSACDEDETCVEGHCDGGCSNDCETDGERVCEGSGFRECGQNDDDPCVEWGEVVPCDGGESCSNGSCAGECSHECDDGERDCEGDGYRTCGQLDEDSCRDWSAIVPCGDGEACDDGECSVRQCTDEGEDCVCGDDECCEGHCCPVFFICIFSDPDEDFCPFGPGPNE